MLKRVIAALLLIVGGITFYKAVMPGKALPASQTAPASKSQN